MASDEDVCTNYPEYAVICSFIENFNEKVKLTLPNIEELQIILEDTENVNPLLARLIGQLLRRINKYVKFDKWERGLQRFAHTYSHQDGWELERFGFKKAKLEVKIRVLKNLFESQFDLYKSFKEKVNMISAKDLRLQPCGRDKHGVSYWCQLDELANLRIYKDDQDEESWALVARSREELVALIEQLKAGTPQNLARENSVEESQSEENTPIMLSEAPTPIDSVAATPVTSGRTSPVLDTGQSKERTGDEQIEMEGSDEEGISDSVDNSKSDKNDISKPISSGMEIKVEATDEKRMKKEDVISSLELPSKDEESSKDICKTTEKDTVQNKMENSQVKDLSLKTNEFQKESVLAAKTDLVVPLNEDKSSSEPSELLKKDAKSKEQLESTQKEPVDLSHDLEMPKETTSASGKERRSAPEDSIHSSYKSLPIEAVKKDARKAPVIGGHPQETLASDLKKDAMSFPAQQKIELVKKETAPEVIKFASSETVKDHVEVAADRDNSNESIHLGKPGIISMNLTTLHKQEIAKELHTKSIVKPDSSEHLPSSNKTYHHGKLETAVDPSTIIASQRPSKLQISKLPEEKSEVNYSTSKDVEPRSFSLAPFIPPVIEEALNLSQTSTMDKNIPDQDIPQSIKLKDRLERKTIDQIFSLTKDKSDLDKVVLGSKSNDAHNFAAECSDNLKILPPKDLKSSVALNLSSKEGKPTEVACKGAMKPLAAVKVDSKTIVKDTVIGQDSNKQVSDDLSSSMAIGGEMAPIAGNLKKEASVVQASTLASPVKTATESVAPSVEATIVSATSSNKVASAATSLAVKTSIALTSPLKMATESAAPSVKTGSIFAVPPVKTTNVSTTSSNKLASEAPVKIASSVASPSLKTAASSARLPVKTTSISTAPSVKECVSSKMAIASAFKIATESTAPPVKASSITTAPPMKTTNIYTASVTPLKTTGSIASPHLKTATASAPLPAEAPITSATPSVKTTSVPVTSSDKLAAESTDPPLQTTSVSAASSNKLSTVSTAPPVKESSASVPSFNKLVAALTAPPVKRTSVSAASSDKLSTVSTAPPVKESSASVPSFNKLVAALTAPPVKRTSVSAASSDKLSTVSTAPPVKESSASVPSFNKLAAALTAPPVKTTSVSAASSDKLAAALIAPPVKTTSFSAASSNKVDSTSTVPPVKTTSVSAASSDKLSTALTAPSVKATSVSAASSDKLAAASIAPPVKTTSVSAASSNKVDSASTVPPVKTTSVSAASSDKVTTASTTPPVKTTSVSAASSDKLAAALTAPPVKTTSVSAASSDKVTTASTAPHVKTTSVSAASSDKLAAALTAPPVKTTSVSAASSDEVTTASTVPPVKATSVSAASSDKLAAALTAPPVKTTSVSAASSDEVTTASTAPPVKTTSVSVASSDKLAAALTAPPVKTTHVSATSSDKLASVLPLKATSSVAAPHLKPDTASAAPPVKTSISTAPSDEAASVVAASPPKLISASAVPPVQTASISAPVIPSVKASDTCPKPGTVSTIAPVKAATVSAPSDKSVSASIVSSMKSAISLTTTSEKAKVSTVAGMKEVVSAVPSMKTSNQSAASMLPVKSANELAALSTETANLLTVQSVIAGNVSEKVICKLASSPKASEIGKQHLELASNLPDKILSTSHSNSRLIPNPDKIPTTEKPVQLKDTVPKNHKESGIVVGSIVSPDLSSNVPVNPLSHVSGAKALVGKENFDDPFSSREVSTMKPDKIETSEPKKPEGDKTKSETQKSPSLIATPINTESDTSNKLVTKTEVDSNENSTNLPADSSAIGSKGRGFVDNETIPAKDNAGTNSNRDSSQTESKSKESVISEKKDKDKDPVIMKDTNSDGSKRKKESVAAEGKEDSAHPKENASKEPAQTVKEDLDRRKTKSDLSKIPTPVRGIEAERTATTIAAKEGSSTITVDPPKNKGESVGANESLKAKDVSATKVTSPLKSDCKSELKEGCLNSSSIAGKDEDDRVIEEPLMIVKGDGEGALCEAGNGCSAEEIEEVNFYNTNTYIRNDKHFCRYKYSSENNDAEPNPKETLPWWENFDTVNDGGVDECEVIVENVRYFWGDGNGVDNEAGNSGDEDETVRIVTRTRRQTRSGKGAPDDENKFNGVKSPSKSKSKTKSEVNCTEASPKDAETNIAVDKTCDRTGTKKISDKVSQKKGTRKSVNGKVEDSLKDTNESSKPPENDDNLSGNEVSSRKNAGKNKSRAKKKRANPPRRKAVKNANEEEHDEEEHEDMKGRMRGRSKSHSDVVEVTVTRQRSARIAKIREKEEHERRELEALRMQEIAQDNRLKELKRKARLERRALREIRKMKKEKKKEKKLKKKKKKRPKKVCPASSDPWLHSSTSSSSSSEDDELELEEEDELVFKSDHEFSPESDVGEEDAQPIKRARTAKKVPTKTAIEEESDEEMSDYDDTKCMKCSHQDHPESILLCDSCDNGWHISCLRPPLFSVPEGEWICPTCEHSVLIGKLSEILEKYDEVKKRADTEELRKQRLAYINISLENILPDKKKKKRDLRSDEEEDTETGSEDSETESDSESETTSETDSDSSSPALYTLRARVSKPLKEQVENFDELIDEAIREEMEAAVLSKKAVSRGKDIATLVEGERGKDVATLVEGERENDMFAKEEDKENEEVQQMEGIGKGKEIRMEESKGEEEESPVMKKVTIKEPEPEGEDDEEVAPKRKKRKQDDEDKGKDDGSEYEESDQEETASTRKKANKRRKGDGAYMAKKKRRLTDLDIEEYDDDSDEDFIGTSEEEEEEASSEEAYTSAFESSDSDDSDVRGRKSSKYGIAPLRRSRRNRINDSDDYEEDERKKKQRNKKRRRRLSSSEDDEEYFSSDSDVSYGKRKRSPAKKARRTAPKSKAKKKSSDRKRSKRSQPKKKKALQQNKEGEGEGEVEKPKPKPAKIKYSKPPKKPEEEALISEKRVTRGRQMNYYESLLMSDEDFDEEEEAPKPKGKVMKGERRHSESSDYEESEDEMKRRRGVRGGLGKGKVMKGEDEDEYKNEKTKKQKKKDSLPTRGKPAAAIKPPPEVAKELEPYKTPADTLKAISSDDKSSTPTNPVALKTPSCTSQSPVKMTINRSGTLSSTAQRGPPPRMQPSPIRTTAPGGARFTPLSQIPTPTLPVTISSSVSITPVSNVSNPPTVPPPRAATRPATIVPCTPVTTPAIDKAASIQPVTSRVPATSSVSKESPFLGKSNRESDQVPAIPESHSSVKRALPVGRDGPANLQTASKWSPHLTGSNGRSNTPPHHGVAPGTPPRITASAPVNSSPPPPYRSSPIPPISIAGVPPGAVAHRNTPPNLPPTTPHPPGYPPYHSPEHFASHPGYPSSYHPVAAHSPGPPRHSILTHPGNLPHGHPMYGVPVSHGAYQPLPPHHPGVLRSPHDLYGAPSHPRPLLLKQGYPCIDAVPYSAGPIDASGGRHNPPGAHSLMREALHSNLGGKRPGPNEGEFSSGLMSYFSSQREDDVE